MAHRQASEENSSAVGSSPEKSTDESGKELLNRRRFVKGAAAVTATLLGTQGSLTAASSSDGKAFRTDFSEYTQ